MKKFTKKVLVTLLVVLSSFSINAPSYSQSNGRIIGYISGEKKAGEMYDLYKHSYGSLFEYMSGWKYIGDRDRTVSYSYDEIYQTCLAEAKKEYYYESNLSLENLTYKIEFRNLPDTTYYTNEVGTGNECKKKARKQKVYLYEATIVGQ